MPSTASASWPSLWLRLDIQIEPIKPAHPEQNGRHERMHLMLKQEATKPAAPNFLQQQARFDAFLERYNHERPHQALGMLLAKYRGCPCTSRSVDSTSLTE